MSSGPAPVCTTRPPPQARSPACSTSDPPPTTWRAWSAACVTTSWTRRRRAPSGRWRACSPTSTSSRRCSPPTPASSRRRPSTACPRTGAATSRSGSTSSRGPGATRRPGRGRVSAGGVEMTGEENAVVAIEELVVHGWDVARASGQDFRPRRRVPGPRRAVPGRVRGAARVREGSLRAAGHRRPRTPPGSTATWPPPAATRRGGPLG